MRSSETTEPVEEPKEAEEESYTYTTISEAQRVPLDDDEDDYFDYSEEEEDEDKEGHQARDEARAQGEEVVEPQFLHKQHQRALRRE